MLTPELRATAEAWLAADPDPQSRAELTGLLAEADDDPATAGELQRRFATRLRFGTAGLRAPMGVGPALMNRVMIRSATEAVMATLPPAARVVIGYDARRNSDVFAADAAACVAAAGGQALVLGQVPTPVAAHAVVTSGADAGIVVTASHNPPEDNGYKLYDASGAQIVPPGDAAVEAHMATAPLPPRKIPPPTSGGSVCRVGSEAIGSYLADITRHLAQVAATPQPGEPLKVVYTPLHGVGAVVLEALFERLDLPAPAVVTSQAQPDGDFPTVSFPNPEEPGALEAAYHLASQIGADLVIANDPDADRLAVAVPAGDSWRRLTGDELGALLADCLLRRRILAVPDEPVLLAASLVSSQLLGAMAAEADVAYSETLTGFKWIARAADGRPERLLFGYEEALGYAVCDAVRDKDGISAAALAVQLAGELREAGSSLLERLDDLYRTHGVHKTGQVTVRFPSVEAVAGPAAATNRLRGNPPTRIAGQRVTALADYSQLGGPLPPTDMLVFGLSAGDRVIVRPSGTEPKLKVYIETIQEVTGGNLQRAKARAQKRLRLLAKELSAIVRDG